jgi:glycosyltransferase involved in cell wall biosynthesis
MNRSAESWLTVITIVKDDLEGLRRSVNSLRGQDLAGVEFIVIDGSSDVERVQVENFIAEFPATLYSWTPPQGVYAAMNDGLNLASGTFVYFLNAGDSLEPGALATFGCLVRESSPDWAFGQVAFVDPSGNEIIPAPFDYEAEKRHFFARGRFPAHQGTLVSRQALQRFGGFDPTYRIAGDYAVMLRFASESTPAVTNQVVARFFLGGLSTTHWRLSLREFHKARRSTLELTLWERFRESRYTALIFFRMLAARMQSDSRRGE